MPLGWSKRMQLLTIFSSVDMNEFKEATDALFALKGTQECLKLIKESKVNTSGDSEALQILKISRFPRKSLRQSIPKFSVDHSRGNHQIISKTMLLNDINR